MIRFTKRSRITFAASSHAPASSAAPASEVSSLWRDGSRVSVLSSADVLSEEDDVIDVDADAVEVVDDAPGSSARPAPRATAPASSRLPVPGSLLPPRMPPKRLTAPEPTSLEPRRAAMRSVPPTSFAPARAMPPSEAAPRAAAKVPTPRPPPRRTTPSIVQSVAPVAMDASDETSPGSEAASSRPSRRRAMGKPSWPFAAALVLVGAVGGFVASMIAHPAPAGTALGAATLTADSTQVTEVVAKPEVAAPKPLTFNDTPLDIRVPAKETAVTSPSEGTTQTGSTQTAAAPAVARVAPSKPAPAPVPVVVAAKPAAPVAAREKEPKAEPKIVELPSRGEREARERDTMRPVAKAPVETPAPVAAAPAAAPRRELSPAAVDALVRQQLNATLH